MILTKMPQYLVEARAKLMIRAIYFSIIYYKCKIIVVAPDADGRALWMGEDIQTACTDGANMVFNGPFMAAFNVDERVFVKAHETWHVMAMHPARMRRYMLAGLYGLPFMPQLYNISADAMINFNLVKSKIGQRPKNCVWIEMIGSYTVTGEETPEEIYKRLIDEHMSQSMRNKLAKLMSSHSDVGPADQQMADKARGGSGPGGGPDPLGNDVIPVSPDKGAANAISEPEMRAVVQQAVNAAKSQGTMPAGLGRFLEEFLNPQVPWEDKLRISVVSRVGHERENYSVPDRRLLLMPGIIMSTRQGLRAGKGAFIVDTSGSVSDKELRQYMGESSYILSDVRPELIYLMWCDARVDAVEELTEAEELLTVTKKTGALGGGGTSFIPPFEYIREHQLDIEFAIYFTDGYGPFPTEDMAPFHMIWCISSDVVAPFGETIKITF